MKSESFFVTQCFIMTSSLQYNGNLNVFKVSVLTMKSAKINPGSLTSLCTFFLILHWLTVLTINDE